MFKEVKEQVKKVIGFSQEFSSDIFDVDELMEKWLEAKRDIIEAFDGKLIYEVPEPVQFHLDPVDRTRKLDDFIHRIQSVYHNSDLASFLALNSEGFYNNSVCEVYEKDEIKIPKGMKLVKAFKFFEKDKALLEQFQIQASQVIQEDKIEGRLCFSVHPLDYLSSSVNGYNWRSCHALDGEFRAGNLSYMLDQSTIICYLKSNDENDVVLPMFPSNVPWNSKKWRVLIYLSQNWDMLMAGRQYPFSSKSGLDLILKYLLPALKLNGEDYCNWRQDYVENYTGKNGNQYDLFSQYIPIRGKLYDFNDIVEDGPRALQFNDLLKSSTYHEPYYSIKNNYGWIHYLSTPKITVGHEVKCLCCHNNFILDSEMMSCRECAETYDLYYDEDHPVCDCCSSTIYNDDWYNVEDHILCRSCYEAETFVCACCYEPHFNDVKHYDKNREEYICLECYEDRYGEEE